MSHLYKSHTHQDKLPLMQRKQDRRLITQIENDAAVRFAGMVDIVTNYALGTLEKVCADSSYEVNIFDQRPGQEYGTGAIVNFAKVKAPLPRPTANGTPLRSMPTARN